MGKTTITIEGLTIAISDMKKMLLFYSAVFNIDFIEIEKYDSKLYSGKWGNLNLLFCPASIARNTAKQNRHQFDIVVPNLKKIIDIALLNGGKKMGEIIEDESNYSIGIYDPDNNSILFKELKV